MAPNSEEPGEGWKSQLSQEPQHPSCPVYNPEDYALSLKKWGRKNGLGLQMSHSTASLDSVTSSASRPTSDARPTSASRPRTSGSSKSSVSSGGGKQPRHAAVVLQPPATGEMTLRQFASVAELLAKLKADLQLAFPSFVQEFVGDPVDGVTLLLELLRSVQLAQASQQQRCPPQVQRRALLDEHSCLVCLQHCLRASDASRRLASSPAGLFTLAVCIMSNVTKSRVLALELLTKACEPPAHGHAAVADALSTLRLRFGEPVRFRFLVGMVNSAGSVELLAAGMRFLNAFLDTAPTVQQRVYIQAELEQAGFNADTLRKTLPSHADSVKAEIRRFEKAFIDVAALQREAHSAAALAEKVQLLEKRIHILQEEKGVLRSLEKCLKDRCTELEGEVGSKASSALRTARVKPYSADRVKPYSTDSVKPYSADRGESTPAEDEGISSSEPEMSHDEDSRPPMEPLKPPRRLMDEPIKPPRINLPDKSIAESTHETTEDVTIEEVIEELQNIAKGDGPKTYLKPEPHKPPKLDACDKTRTFTKSDVTEAEIVPGRILPQPPRRAKSLVHIFLPGRGCDDGKHEFFDEDTDSESEDSLLTRQRRKDAPLRQNFGSAGSVNVCDAEPSSRVKVDAWNATPTRAPHSFRQNRQPRYQERNIDEEAKKRGPSLLPERLTGGVSEGKPRNESPFVRRTQRFVPVPVKRSQTFHTQDSKGKEIRPKPKMGVSGLDLKRNEHGKYQNIDYKNRYVRKSKEKVDLNRRGSLDELTFSNEAPPPLPPEPSAKTRSKSLERVDSGMESLVDIVVDPGRNRKGDIRNIGPRTRRSLAESSLFTKPQPKQRTSLARHNSGSSIPLTLPVEIFDGPAFTRAPPDGSCSPHDCEATPRKPPKAEESPIYATPIKTSKLQKFFGNPKFESSPGEANPKYFESNYACLGERAQPASKNVVKALLQPHPQKPAVPNFYLGTYQARPTPSKPPSNPSSSLSSFNPPFLLKRGTTNAGLYSGNRENLCSPTPTETSNGSSRVSGSSRTTAKLSDSISGLY